MRCVSAPHDSGQFCCFQQHPLNVPVLPGRVILFILIRELNHRHVRSHRGRPCVPFQIFRQVPDFLCFPGIAFRQCPDRPGCFRSSLLPFRLPCFPCGPSGLGLRMDRLQAFRDPLIMFRFPGIADFSPDSPDSLTGGFLRFSRISGRLHPRRSSCHHHIPPRPPHRAGPQMGV